MAENRLSTEIRRQISLPVQFDVPVLFEDGRVLGGDGCAGYGCGTSEGAPTTDGPHPRAVCAGGRGDVQNGGPVGKSSEQQPATQQERRAGLKRGR